MVERKLWSKVYTSTPGWTCPRCSKGILLSVEKTLLNEESDFSKSAHSHDAWDFDWITTRYSEHLACSDTNCGERCVVVGTGGVEEYQSHDPYGRPERETVTYYCPEFIHPTPLLFTPVKETPDNIVADIQSASSLFWTDTSSSANKLRLCSERILTALKVKRFTLTRPNSGGKRKRIPFILNNRIQAVEAKHPEIAKLLNSIRFLGNHGSHENDIEVSHDDLLDAFEIMEHVLELAFSKKAERIAKAANSIAKRKGKPLKPSRRRRR